MKISALISIIFLLFVFADLQAVGIQKQNTRSTLVKLPWSKYELERISEIVSSDGFYGDEATESQFKVTAPTYRILHIAAHAVFNDSSLLYSSLIFNKDDNSDEDGIFYTYELYNLRLNAQLTVLSACNTGMGKLVNGEGIFSLARGFMYAGSPSVVMSLWSVDDRSTSLIMTDFYTGISGGSRIGNALRKAKLKYLEEANEITASPLYWAGMVSYGCQDPVTINDKPGSNVFLFIVIILIMLMMPVYFVLKKLRTV